MTTTPEPVTSSPQPKPATAFKNVNVSVLDDMFNLGYTTSADVLVYESAGTSIVATFRTLVPAEMRDVHEAVGAFRSMGAQFITEQIELLARGVVTINNMPLILDQHDREELSKKLDRADLTPLEQARYIFLNKIRSKPVLDMLYDKYMEFIQSIEKEFEEVKKKLKEDPGQSS
jgi:hypothetical protein